MSLLSNNTLAGSSGQGGGDFAIKRSLRFNSGDSAYLSRTPSSAGNQKTFTWSGWVKLSQDASAMYFFGTNTQFVISFTAANKLDVQNYTSGSNHDLRVTTNRSFRDQSAWYHLVVSIDTTQATASDRAKIYINGTLETSFATATYPSQNFDCAVNTTVQHAIGTFGTSTSASFDGYMADINFIDGVSGLTASDFGEYDDNNVWQPIKYAGTYGTNGFHLDFSDTSSNSALGTDSSGAGNNWSVNNLVGPDVPAVNYSAMLTNVTAASAVNAFQALPNYRQTGAYVGSYTSGSGITFTPIGGIAVSSSLQVFYGGYINAATLETLIITYTDSTTETDTFTTGSSNWMTSFTASNAAGKTIQSITVNGSWTQFGGFIIDSVALLSSAGSIPDALRDSPSQIADQTDTGVGGEVVGNYATWNPLFGENQSLSNGNLKAESSSTGYAIIASTLAMKSGKWYMEYTYTPNNGYPYITWGISQTNRDGTAGSGVTDTAEDKGFKALDSGFYSQSAGQNVHDYSSSVSSGDIISLAFDADAGKLWVAKNGTWMTNASGTGDPATGANPDYSGLDYSGGYYFMAGPYYTNGSTLEANFGQLRWAYAAPTNFKALCTANLPDPTIADGSTAFDTKLYAGDGQATNQITGLNMSPDLVWIKNRSYNSTDHYLTDIVRGPGKFLYSNTTGSESATDSQFASFNSDGFTVSGNNNINDQSSSFASWAWDAGSSVETLSAGDKNSQFVNQDQLWSSYGTFSNDNSTYNWTAVFSLASHFSTGGSMYNNGPSPATWVLTSGLSCSNTISFYVFGTNVSMTINYGLSDETTFVSSGYNRNYTFTMPFTGTIQNIRMNTGATYLGRIAVDGKMLIDNNLTFNVPSSSTSITKNDSAGFSITKFNSGTGASDPSPYIGGGYDYVYHGLNKPPEFIITKSLDSAQDWAVWHEKLSNAPSSYLKLNHPHALASSNYWSPQIEIYEMGQTQSAVAGDYISYNWTSVEGYSAFGKFESNNSADGPFVFLGFKPKWILIKHIDISYNWQIWDTERSPYNVMDDILVPNESDAEATGAGYNFDFVSNGFKIRNNYMQGSNQTLVYAAFAEHPFKTSRAR